MRHGRDRASRQACIVPEYPICWANATAFAPARTADRPHRQVTAHRMTRLERQRRGDGTDAAAPCGGGQGDALILQVPANWASNSVRLNMISDRHR